MWWLPLAIGMAAAGIILVQFGFVPPPHAVTLVWIRESQLQVARGRLRAQAREFLADILAEAGITRGFVAVTPGKRVAFSRTIPPGIRQRIRNVLLNV